MAVVGDERIDAHGLDGVIMSSFDGARQVDAARFRAMPVGGAGVLQAMFYL
jgi:hypothetical protein